MRNILFCFITLFLLMACSKKEQADLLVHNATIYTVDSNFNKVEAFVVKNGKILETGNLKDLQEKYDVKDTLDAEGKFIFPGFIDAHAHFIGYGMGLQTVNLTGTESWDEIIQRVKEFAAANPGDWIIGRGWDQNDWANKNFPTNEILNQLFPDKPLVLTRIDGHAAIANQHALDLAGITPGMQINGGIVETKNGKLTGLLVDNAIDLVTAKRPAPTEAQYRKALKDAEKNCFAFGLTTIDDCGLSADMVERIRKFQESGDLQMRIYAMLSDEKQNYDYLEKNGIIKTDRLHVRAFKVYGDGALGSRGACLLEPYADKPEETGFLLSKQQHFDSVANWIYTKGFQMCTHAIGDSGNRTMLNIYGKYLKEKNDKRWRIEHAQVVHANDLEMFGKYSIIPSVQPTHATSDMYWAGDRLGAERVKTAYAFKQLLEQNEWMPLGTDFPVEDISPFKTFYAAVVRKDAKGWPENGYQVENALSREQAIRGMTIWAAKSNFEENEKGSIEKGKFADFIILDTDLMKEANEKLLTTHAIRTYLNGKLVYSR